MSGEGRTTWWPCDAAEHDRELVVELGEEHGPAGPYVMRVLKDLAQQQRDGGRVRTGFRSLRQKTFIGDVRRVRAIVEQAALIGALDDLDVDPDGRRFTCRVSGWEADQVRGRAAIRKAAQREGDTVVPPEGDTSRSVTVGSAGTPDASDDPGEGHEQAPAASLAVTAPVDTVTSEGDNNPSLSTPDGTDAGVVHPEGDVSRSVPLNRAEQSRTEQRTAETALVDPDRIDAARQRLINEQVHQVFDAWVAATSRNAARTKLTDERRRRIQKALASHGLEDCLQAVRNIGADEWAAGANDRQKPFNDIEHALGSSKRIEGWRDANPRGPSQGSPGSRENRRARGTDALRSMMSEAVA